MMPHSRSQIDEFSELELENQSMMQEIENMERSFAQTDN